MVAPVAFSQTRPLFSVEDVEAGARAEMGTRAGAKTLVDLEADLEERFEVIDVHLCQIEG